MTQITRIIAASGGAVGRGGQAEPEHLLGGVDIEQVPRGGRAPLLHHQDRRAASGITGPGNNVCTIGLVKFVPALTSDP